MDEHNQRRDFLKLLGKGMLAIPSAALWGGALQSMTSCGGSTLISNVPNANNSHDATHDNRSVDVGASTVAWARGMASSLGNSFSDPFVDGIGATCALYEASTLGPCYETAPTRKDISENIVGLPTRMSFLLLNRRCEPVSGANIDVWHTAPNGVYSGASLPSICTQGNADAQRSQWFRGNRNTDRDGRVDFDTCYPGWYPGRTLHIHFTVRHEGREYLTSQLYFDEALNDSIINTHPDYNNRGARDTTNARDGVLRSNPITNHTFNWEKRADGTLHLHKALILPI